MESSAALQWEHCVCTTLVSSKEDATPCSSGCNVQNCVGERRALHALFSSHKKKTSWLLSYIRTSLDPFHPFHMQALTYVP